MMRFAVSSDKTKVIYRIINFANIWAVPVSLWAGAHAKAALKVSR